MDLDSLLSATCGWLEGTGSESDVVVSSRIRLARNLAQYPFLSRANNSTKTEIERLLREKIFNALTSAPQTVEAEATRTEDSTEENLESSPRPLSRFAPSSLTCSMSRSTTSQKLTVSS